MKTPEVVGELDALKAEVAQTEAQLKKAQHEIEGRLMPRIFFDTSFAVVPTFAFRTA